VVKNFGKKAAAKDWQKNWRMLTCIANHQSLIINKTKPNEAIPNIDEYNEMNCSNVLFDDGKGCVYICDLILENRLICHA